VAAEERAAAFAASLLEEEAQAEAAKEAGTKKKKKKGKKKGGAAVATHTPSPPPQEHGPTSNLEPSNDSDDTQVRLYYHGRRRDPTRGIFSSRHVPSSSVAHDGSLQGCE
jgi:hypothetical protein